MSRYIEQMDEYLRQIKRQGRERRWANDLAVAECRALMRNNRMPMTHIDEGLAENVRAMQDNVRALGAAHQDMRTINQGLAENHGLFRKARQELRDIRHAINGFFMELGA